MSQTQNCSGFEALPLTADLCRLLTENNLITPTPIQAAAIPIAAEGHDVIGIAQTGTGKTLAFSLPMVQNLAPGQVGLILAPTRELALQIQETLDKLRMRSVLIVGGASMHVQVKQIRMKPQVTVATPGRLIDHLQQGTIRLDRVKVLVLDEADRMLDMGFLPAIRRILTEVPGERQTLLFSATMPREVEDLARDFMSDPQRIEVSPPGTAPELVEQQMIYVKFEEKQSKLAELLYDNAGSVLVFARTRHGARKLTKVIQNDGHQAAEIHADRTLAQRREAINGFKTGRYRVLVATDIAARGIDVKGISLVINYDLPDQSEDYLHRIGRTGRAGATGRAVSLVLPDQKGKVRSIEKLLGVSLTGDKIPQNERGGRRNTESFDKAVVHAPVEEPRRREEQPGFWERRERPARDESRSWENRGGDRPQNRDNGRPWENRNNDRPQNRDNGRPWENRSNDRPQNRDNNRPWENRSNDRPQSRDNNRPWENRNNDRPQNRDNNRPWENRSNDRPQSRDNNRPWENRNNDRPQSRDNNRPWENRSNDRPQNRDNNRPWENRSNDRPQNRDNSRPWENRSNDRPQSRDNNRPWENRSNDRPQSRDNNRPWENRSNDRPQSRDNNRPWESRPGKPAGAQSKVSYKKGKPSGPRPAWTLAKAKPASWKKRRG